MQEMQETWVQFLGQEGPLGKEMARHSRTLVWSIPWTEVPGPLQSTGLQRDVTEHTLIHTHPTTEGFAWTLFEMCLMWSGCRWRQFSSTNTLTFSKTHTLPLLCPSTCEMSSLAMSPPDQSDPGERGASWTRAFSWSVICWEAGLGWKNGHSKAGWGQVESSWSWCCLSQQVVTMSQADPVKGASPTASDCSVPWLLTVACPHTLVATGRRRRRGPWLRAGALILLGTDLHGLPRQRAASLSSWLSPLWRSIWAQTYGTSRPGLVLGIKHQLLPLLNWVMFLLCFWSCKSKITGSVSNGCWGWMMVHLKYSAPGWPIRLSFWMFVFFLSAS